jgi:hypothetical protein
VPRRRSFILLATAGLTAMSLAGCGSSSGTAHDGSPSASPSPKSSSASASAHQAAANQASTSSELLDRINKAVTAKGSVVTSLNSVSSAGKLTGQGPTRFGSSPAGDFALEVRTPASSDKIRAVYVDNAFYLQLGSSVPLPSGKSWLGLSQADVQGDNAAAFGPIISSLNQLGNVQAGFAVLGAATTFTPGGQETVGGVPTVKYDVAIDVAKAAQSSDPATAKQYQTLKNAGVSTLTYSVWVDGDDLPRKLSSSTDVGGSTTATTVTYSDWGKSVTIQAPPAEQVAHLADVL